MSGLGVARTAGAPANLEAAAAPRRGRRFWRRFARHKLAVAGAIILIALVAMAAFAPIVAPKDPNKGDFLNIDASPGWSHLLGTDGNGRDYWSRLVYGGRVSLSVGIVATLIAAGIGTLLGSLSGYYGKYVDLTIQRFTELVMTFPQLLVIITLVAFLGPSLFNIMAVFGLLGWTSFCRIVRGQVLSVREMTFVEAARTAGAPNAAIMFKHILPNVLPFIVVYGTLNVAGIILAEAGLSFLGLGVQAPTATWGNMLWAAQTLDTLVNRPLRWIAPGAAIMICVLAINLVGDGLRDALDPRSRKNHQ
jgi:peptide/nickel transport system permease protein